MKTKSKTIKNRENTSYIFYGLLVLLFYPPFFRGLFFQKELMVSHIFTAIIFLAYFLLHRKTEELKSYSWFEIGFLTLIGVYILSTIMAVNTNLAIQETLKYINYICIILLSKRLIDNEQKLTTALTTMVCAGVIVVLIGTGTALETFSYNGAFVGGMMSSTFQYHNAFGTYCLAMLFLTYALTTIYSGAMKYIMGISSYLFFFGFIISYSRGAWVLLPLVGLIYYVLMPTKYKISFMGGLLGNLLGVMVIIKPFTAAIDSEYKAMGWLWLILGMAVSLAVSIMIEKMLTKINLNEKIYNRLIPIIALMIPVLTLSFKDKILGFLPASLAQRLGSISLGTETVTERTVFYKDALSIIKDYPFFGTGGGGWSTLYRAYQSYGYSSTQAHNYYMQLWIEAGTIGIIVFAALLMLYLYYCIKTYKSMEETPSKAMFVAMFIGVITLLIHSVIDFDLALSAIAMMMWAMVGMQLGMNPEFSKIPSNMNRWISYKVIGLAVILLLVGSTNHMAMNAAKQGIIGIQSKDYEKGEKYFKRAVALSPFDSGYMADYANISIAMAEQKGDKQGIKKSIETMDKAVELGQYDNKMLINGASFYLRNGEIDKGLEAIHNIEKYHPLNSITYENKAEFYVVLADHYIKENKPEEAIPLLQSVLAIEDKVNQLNEEIKSKVEINNMVRFVQINPKTQENMDKAKEMINDLSK